MNPKSFTEARDSQLTSNTSQGGSLPQIRPGEKRVTTSRTTSGSVTTSSDRAVAITQRPKAAPVRARIVSVDGVITIVYE